MAPLDISDQINVAAVAGTWLGTLFTAIGLVAVFSQLRSVMRDMQQSQTTFLARYAGGWTALIPNEAMPQRGLVERVAPGFLGWVQRAYMYNMHACLTQCGRPTAGTTGWSNLFAQCGIQAAALFQFGGPNARVFPAVTGDLGPGAPRLADLIFDNGRVLYGFSQNEFTALLIICGFSLSDFSITGCTTSTNFLGTMQLADHEPFSQVAQFDSHEACRTIAQDQERHIIQVPIQTCVDYAVGLLRTPKRGDHSFIIPAATSPTAAENSEIAAWTIRPRAAQLNEIRLTLEQLVSVSGADVLKYSVETSGDVEYESFAMDKIAPGNSFGGAMTRQTLLIAHALAALKPWGLLPVLPRHFVQAFKPLVFPFVGSHSETVIVLQKNMCDLGLKPLDGWDSIQQQAMGLGQIGGIKDEFFSGSCAPCRNYYKAMIMVLDAHNVRVDEVRITLAALAARRYISGIVTDEFVPNLTAHLSQGRLSGKNIPPWAITVFATYLWGWLNDFVEMDFDFRAKFKRRIFLN